jgi:hypothetical protein
MAVAVAYNINPRVRERIEKVHLNEIIKNFFDGCPEAVVCIIAPHLGARSSQYELKKDSRVKTAPEPALQHKKRRPTIENQMFRIFHFAFFSKLDPTQPCGRLSKIRGNPFQICLHPGVQNNVPILGREPVPQTTPNTLGPRCSISPSTADESSAGPMSTLSVGPWWCKIPFRSTSQILTRRTMRAGSTC